LRDFTILSPQNLVVNLY